MAEPTLRQALIVQLRKALGELERPVEQDEEIAFQVVEVDYNFTGQDLDGPVPHYWRDVLLDES